MSDGARMTGHPDRTGLWKPTIRPEHIPNPVSGQWRALVRLPDITSGTATLGSVARKSLLQFRVFGFGYFAFVTSTTPLVVSSFQKLLLGRWGVNDFQS
jgi:hypothetical protein